MTTNFNDYRSNVTSQNGEDGVLEEIFKRIGTKNRWCCEFGAWDGYILSNTYNLLRNEGWSGVLIEGNEEKFLELQANTLDRPDIIDMCTTVSATGFNSLDNLLSETIIPTNFDLLSIDIDGDDYHVWEAVKDYQPRAVVIEVNSEYPVTKDMIPGEEGASVKSMVELGRRKGYELVTHTGNAIFVLKEYAEVLKLEDPWQDRFDTSWIKHT